MSIPLKRDLHAFAHEQGLEGLSSASLQAVAEGREGYTLDRARGLLAFKGRIDRELLGHRVIIANPYTAWFSRGAQSLEQLRAFIVQFSVFSNQFLVAQLQKVINADSLEGMRASKEILANEIGVVFKGPGRPRGTAGEAVDPELVATEGSVDGGVFRFRAAHFEWLARIAERLGLGFADVGRRRHGTETTLFFCDELIRLYGNPRCEIAQAASFAVENWAAAGFWGELIQGLERFNRRTGMALPLAFFTWHDRLEAQHARHTQAELEEMYLERGIDEDTFLLYANEMLDGVALFWEGLDAQRRHLA